MRNLILFCIALLLAGGMTACSDGTRQISWPWGEDSDFNKQEYGGVTEAEAKWQAQCADGNCDWYPALESITFTTGQDNKEIKVKVVTVEGLTLEFSSAESLGIEAIRERAAAEIAGTEAITGTVDNVVDTIGDVVAPVPLGGVE